MVRLEAVLLLYSKVREKAVCNCWPSSSCQLKKKTSLGIQPGAMHLFNPEVSSAKFNWPARVVGFSFSLECYHSYSHSYYAFVLSSHFNLHSVVTILFLDFYLSHPL